MATPDGLRAWLCIERLTNGEIRDSRISNLPGGPGHCFFTGVSGHLPDCGERLLINPAHFVPMYRSSGLSGAWYPEMDGDEPDGWLWEGTR